MLIVVTVVLLILSLKLFLYKFLISSYFVSCLAMLVKLFDGHGFDGTISSRSIINKIL